MPTLARPRARARHTVASALVVALLALPSSASAATYRIKAYSNDTFSPSVLTVNQGNLVKWINKGGYHEVDITKPSRYVVTNPSAELGKMAEPDGHGGPTAGEGRLDVERSPHAAGRMERAHEGEAAGHDRSLGHLP